METTKPWFNDALDCLNEEISSNGSVDGASFLTDYLSKNWPKDLDDSVEDEAFELYVNENIDIFEAWLSSNETQVVVDEDYTWNHSATVITRPIARDDCMEKGDIDTSIVDKKLEELTDSDFYELCQQRDILYLKGNIHRAELAALKTAKLADRNQHIDVSARVRAWELYGEIRDKQNEGDAYINFEKAGSIALSNGDTLNAAILFSKAAETYCGDEWKIKHHLIRTARVLFTDAGVNDKASEKYIEECNLKIKNADGIDALKGHFYCVLSKYGESPLRVFAWMGTVIILCALLYWFVDINTPGQGVFECKSALVSQSKFTCKEVAGEQASLLTHFYFSFVTFTTLGYGDYSPTVGFARFIASIQALLGLILSSLFIATFLRKFSR